MYRKSETAVLNMYIKKREKKKERKERETSKISGRSIYGVYTILYMYGVRSI